MPLHKEYFHASLTSKVDKKPPRKGCYYSSLTRKVIDKGSANKKWAAKHPYYTTTTCQLLSEKKTPQEDGGCSCMGRGRKWFSKTPTRQINVQYHSRVKTVMFHHKISLTEQRADLAIRFPATHEETVLGSN